MSNRPQKKLARNPGGHPHLAGLQNDVAPSPCLLVLPLHAIGRQRNGFSGAASHAQQLLCHSKRIVFPYLEIRGIELLTQANQLRPVGNSPVEKHVCPH
jgi:hypothetical protein